MEFLWHHKHNDYWASLLWGLASTQFNSRTNADNAQDIIKFLPTQALGDYSIYKYQEEDQVIEFANLLDQYNSESDSSSESESDNNR